MWRGRLRINAPVSFGLHALSGHLPEYQGFSYTELRTRWTFEGQDGQTISVAVRGKLMVDSGEALLMATRAGMGILLQPDELVHDDLAAGTLVEMLPEYSVPTCPFHLLYAPDRRMTPKLRSFIDFAESAFWG
jgi:DNA-binding transcriptional LysR family regulator